MFSMTQGKQNDSTRDHESQFVRHFVVPAKRARYLSLLESRRGRNKLRQMLDHFTDLDMRWAKTVPPNAQTPDQIELLLKRKGASDLCIIMSSDGSIDGRQVSLSDALQQTIGSGSGTIISCIAGRLAYFEGEDNNTRYILEYPT